MNEILQQRIEEAASHYLLHEHKSPLNKILHQCDLKTEMQYHRDIEQAYIEGSKGALQNQWISVDEDLPKYDEVVIAMEYNPELSWKDQSILFAHRSKNSDVWRDKNDFCIYPPTIMKITHWMETPFFKGDKK